MKIKPEHQGGCRIRLSSFLGDPNKFLSRTAVTTNWFQIRKGVHQGYILTPCLFNLYAEYIMRHAGLDEAQAGIKIVRRNISHLRYADDTTLMVESEEELKASF